MGMREFTRYELECDNCYKTYGDSSDDTKLTRGAQKGGWRYVEGEWLCAQCYARTAVGVRETVMARYALSAAELDDLLGRDPLGDEARAAQRRERLLAERPWLRHAIEDLEAAS